MDQPGPKEHLTGKVFDRDTGLYYFHARWYDPEVGRFVGRDPVTIEDQYAFNWNRPTISVDPAGLYSFPPYHDIMMPGQGDIFFNGFWSPAGCLKDPKFGWNAPKGKNELQVILNQVCWNGVMNYDCMKKDLRNKCRLSKEQINSLEKTLSEFCLTGTVQCDGWRCNGERCGYTIPQIYPNTIVICAEWEDRTPGHEIAHLAGIETGIFDKEDQTVNNCVGSVLAKNWGDSW
jgi:RHS repeat-associated protein